MEGGIWGILASASKEFLGALMKFKYVGVDHGKDDLDVFIVREAAS